MANNIEIIVGNGNRKNFLEKLGNIDWRIASADTFSMITFSFLVEAPRELAIGMTPEETLYTRLLGIPIDLFIGRPYGVYLDWIRKKFDAEKVEGIFTKKRFKRTIADTFAFTTAMAPVYSCALYLSDVDLKTGAAAVVSGAAYSLFQGAPYGAYNTFVRKMFKRKNNS